MEHVLSPSPRLPFAGRSLDAKRIAATSGAILVHAGILMMLLLPAVPADAPVEPEVVTIVDFKIPEIPIIPPPVEREVVVRQQPTPALVPLPDPPVIPTDDTRSVVDVYVPPLPDPPIANTFDAIATGPVFAQIVARVAPTPPYPKRALHLQQSGEVVLRIRVDATGMPLEVTIETSSGSSILDEAARKFVASRWRFVPATRDGQAVEALALLPIAFTLPD